MERVERTEVSKRIVKFDVNTISPGDRWTQEQQAEMVGAQPGTDEYRFRVLQLKDHIERTREQLGIPLKCWHERGALVFGAGDAHQLAHAKRRDASMKRTKVKLREELILVQKSKLNDDEAAERDHMLNRVSIQILLDRDIDLKLIVSSDGNGPKFDVSQVKKLLGGRH